MTPREITEQWEENLSEFAVRSKDSKGRKTLTGKCDIRTEFQRDRDKITHSKAFRRLMHKTQVFIAPEGDHYRTRLTHTLEVAQISRTIARALRLNEDLTEAIALGHDLGHTPFGHTGEDALDQISPIGFQHNKQSIRIAEELENGGAGLNLTYEVLDGILNHRTEGNPATLEGAVVQLSDKIGYINHDIDDAIRAGILKAEELPADCVEILGKTSKERIDFLVRNIILTSNGKNKIAMQPEARAAMNNLRQHMFNTVYLHQIHRKERNKIHHMLNELHKYFLRHQDRIPVEFTRMIDRGVAPEVCVCDYIACMTDRFALKTFASIFMPNVWNIDVNQ